MNDNDDVSSCSTSASAYEEPEYEWEEIPIPGVVALQNDDDEHENDNLQDDDVVVDDFCLHVLTVVPPPLEYMSRLHSQQQEISGRQVWTGSLFLANVLFLDATERQILLSCRPQQKRILELGSGTGVLGMALYKFLSLRHINKNNDNNQQNQHHPIVALTDGDTKVVELLQQNLNHADNRNAMQHLHHDHSCGDDDDKKYECCCKATCLEWGVPGSLSQFDDWCRESFSSSRTFNSSVLGTTTSQADDDEDDAKTVSSLPPPPSFVFDVIVAGDVLYKPDLPRIFFDTVRQLLLRRQQQEQEQQDQQGTDDIINNDQQSSSNCSGSSGAGILWLCHVPRSTVTHELVLQAANQAGFTLEQTISLDRLKQTTRSSNKSIEKFLDGCPLEDVVRARVYRMVLQTEVGQVKKIVNR